MDLFGLDSVRLLTERFCAKPVPACQKRALSLYRAWVSALLAGVLFLASPRKSSQKEGDPRLRGWLRQLPCATRMSGRLAKLACGSDNASRLPRPFSVARRSTWGPERRDGSSSAEIIWRLRSTGKTAKNEGCSARCDASPLHPTPVTPAQAGVQAVHGFPPACTTVRDIFR